MARQTEPRQRSTAKKPTSTKAALEQQLAQRNGELAILNTVQQALASKLDLQAIYNLVGDQVRDIFKAEVVYIAVRNPVDFNKIDFPYYVDRGKYVKAVPLTLGEGLTSRVIAGRQPLLIGTMAEQIRLGVVFEAEERANTYLGIPILIGDLVVGVVSVQSYQENAFNDADVRLLTTLASSMGVALENARLLDQTQRRAEEVITLAEIGREISASLDLSTVLERIASHAMHLLHARDVVLRLLESDGRLRAAVAIGKYAEIYKDWDAQLGEGLSGNVAKTGVAEIINHPGNDPRVIDLPGTEEDQATRAILFAPLMIGEVVIGVLSVWRNKLEAGPFTQADLDFGLSLARRAAIAIQNARLFAETQQRFKETEILRAANLALTHSLDLDTILGVLLDYLQQIVPYDSGSVFLLEDGHHLTALAARGYEDWVENPEKAVGIRFNYKNIPHIRTVIEDQTTLIIPDVRQHPSWVVAETAGHVRNWLAVPLVAGGKTIGMYSLDKVEPGYFTSEHQRLAENLAAQAAIAFQNATLFRNQQVAREQAETLRAAASALGSTLSLRQVFELILSELRKVVPYDSCSVQQLDDNEMVIVGGHGFPNLDELLGNRFDWRGLDDPAGEVVRQRQPVIIEDVSARFKHFKDDTHGKGRVHGWMGVPLLFGERLIGMLTLDKSEIGFYTGEQAKMAQAFAAQAATAIENARLFDETQRLLKETKEAKDVTETLYNITQVLGKTLDLQDIFDVILGELQKVVPYDSSSVQVIRNNRLVIVGGRGFENLQALLGISFDLEDETNPSVRAVLTKHRQVFGDVSTHPHFMSQIHGGGKIRGWIGAPLIFGERVIGVITLDKFEPDFYNDRLAELVMAFAAQAAVSIENARLFETERVARQQAETLRAAAQAISSTLSLQQVFDLILSELRKVVPYDSCSVQQLDGNTMVIVGGHGFPNLEELLGNRFDWRGPDDPAGEVVHRLEPVIIADVSARFKHFKDETHGQGRVHGWLGVPLLFGERMIGMLTLDKLEKDFYTPAHAHMAQAFATQAATAIENARLFDETQRLLKMTEERAAELAIINSVQEGLASKLEMQAIYDLIGDKIRDIFDAQVVDIGLFDPTDQLLHFPYAIERGERFPDEPMQLVGFRKYVIQTQHPLLINEKMVEAAEKYGNPLAFQGEASKACLYVPMLVGGEAKGVISLQNLDHENAFSESDVSLLTTLTNAMSVALENARLFDETQRLLKITEERAQELAILNSVGEAMAKTLDVKTVTRIVGDKVRDIFSAEVTEILLRDANSDFIHVPYAFAKEYQDVEPFAMGDGLTSKVILSGKPLVLDTFEQGVELGALTPTEEDKTESYMGVPIVAGEKMLGVVSVQSYKQNAYNQSHVHLLQTLSSNMGVAIENARLFDETQRLLKITEERAAELAIINSVQEGLASKLIMQAIYDLIGDKIRDIFDAQVVDIGIYDRNEKFLHFPYTIERGVRFPDEPMRLIGYRKHAMETRQPLLINQDTLSAAARYGNPIALQGEIPKSILYVPMLVGGEAIGVISLQNLDRENAFSESDVSLLMTLTNAMSVALENARLFDETQRLLRVTEERAAELGAISKVSQALIVESELDNTIQLIGNQMREIFSADIVYLALLDTQTNLIHFPYQYGESFTTLTLGQGLTSKIIQTGEPLLINQDVVATTAQIGATRVGKEALSYLGVPIKTGKGTIGVISVQSTTQEGLFDDDSLRLLTTIAANAGAALHNAQLFSEALENLRQVEILTNAASAIEQSAYEPAMIESVAARTDALGELARVFRKMADEVRLREQRLKRQLAQMQMDIEEKKLAKAETVAIYVPMDRRQAMAEHLTLSERAHGTALFADVSGFTALTESLANELGLQRGAEEMIRHLNRVLTALIDEIHRYSGAVISFSGDAITCWFDDLDLNGHPRADLSVERAAACAFAMQKGMAQFAAISTPNGKMIGLSIKVALATGPTRRMVVGDGNAHQIDVLAGATLTALTEAEHVTEKGEIVFSAAGFASLEEKFSVAEWRKTKQFAVLAGLKQEIAPSPWAELGEDAILQSRLRPWMHPAVFEKVRAGQSEMLSELRPATALFMKFGGFDYDHDPKADTKLKAFIQWVEQVIAPHNGAIIQFTVGDKGSYIYIVFGAPITHRDDTAQAVFTALELAAPPESLAFVTGLYIGLASGQMRVGAYGGAGHRTYGAIGDRTNLAARLMVAASRSSAEIPAGQRAIVFCNDSVYAVTQAQVEFESLPSIIVKGKTEPIAIYRPLRKLAEPITETGSALGRAHLIDQLSPAEQLTLKVASVVGQLFTLEAVAAIYPEKQTRENQQKHLQSLSNLDLIVKRPGETSSYNFKDAQTHEAAYNLMLFAQRRQLHRAMAELLEQTIFSVPPYAEIAHHWQAADEIPKAIVYLEKAGEHARQTGDFEEATRFFNESLALNK